jgi:crotonobetainyl-CoA:carnitine CoA-transferase CaiB-like acyl-CoA transferase
MLEALVAAEDISYGGVLNGGAEYPGPRPGMIVHRIGERYLALQTVGAPQLWARITGAMGRHDLVSDPRFATPAARREHWGEIRPIVTAWLDGFDTVEAAIEALRAARVPCAPVLAPAEVAGHPHMAARHAFPAVPHPTRGEVRVTATPFHIDHAPVRPAAGAPYRVGEHTHAVLRDVLGYPEDRIEELTRQRVIDVP